MALFRPKFAPVQSYVTFSLIYGSPDMGSFLTIVIKLSRFKDGGIKKSRKLGYFYNYFRHS